MRFSRILIASSLLLISCFLNPLAINQVSAASSNHYLPIKTDPLIELELEKLATLAQMPVLAKPYHLATVQQYLNKIKKSHPELFRRINQYVNRYRANYNITHLSAEASYSDFDGKSLPNQRGRTTESNFKGEIAGFWQLSDNFNLSVGGTLYDGSEGFIPNNTYLSYYNEYFQIDLGWKELWLSPFQESAMLLSTHAKPIARFSISSPTPLTDFNLRYDISFGKLEEMDNIRVEDERLPGKPGFLTTHLSAQLFDWWTIGGTRTMMFGGGGRDVGLGDLWDAFIDPVSGDNCGGSSDLQDCSAEVGNQQASVLNKFDFSVAGMPIQINLEVAGEDTNDFKAYKLGNKTYNLGLFLPYLTENSSLLAEYQHIENFWYVHAIYGDGYTNEGNVMGHWWGDERLNNQGIGGRVFTIRYNHELSNEYHLDVKLASFENLNLSDEGSFNESIYERGNELTLGLNKIGVSDIWRVELYAGNTVLGDEFARLSVKYSWQ